MLDSEWLEPALADTPVDDQGRALRGWQCVKNPVFFDGRYLGIKFYIPDQVLLWIALGENFCNEDGPKIFPPNHVERQL